MSTRQTGTGPEGATSNPLLEDWATPFGLPPFDRVTPDHFRPAFDRATAEHRAEIAAIAGDPAEPTFANTVDAFERAGRALDRVVGGVLRPRRRRTPATRSRRSSARSPRCWPGTAARSSWTRPCSAASTRCSRDATTSASRPSRRGCWSGCIRPSCAPARGSAGSERERLAAIDERLATLGTRFGQNVLADERAWVLVLETEDDLAGLPDFVRAAAARAAADRGLAGKHVVTLARSSVVPFLQFSARRDLRERAFAAWTGRGESGGDTDNRAIAAETLALRAERARLLGYPTYAHYRLDDTMAKTPEAVRDLLDRVWAPARALAPAGARRAAGRRRGGGRQLRARTLGLAPLRREGPPGPSTTSTRPRSSRTSSSTT